MLIRRALLLIVTTACISCAHAPVTTTSTQSVWVLDLVRTLPGAQEEYLRNIRSNWGGGRRIATQMGAVLSYRAMATTPDSARGWDVILLTEYRDSSAFVNREETFRRIFADPRYVAGRVTTRPSAELRAFVATEVLMRSVVESGRR